MKSASGNRRKTKLPKRTPEASRALIGTWRLVSCEHVYSDGRVERPFGDSPIGRLVYTPDGYMIVMLGDPNRPLFKSHGIFEGSEGELAAAARGFIAYSGRCELSEDQVVHRVDVSLFPNWIGTAQLRKYEINGERVRFSTRPFVSNGIEQTAHLVWERQR